MQKWEYCYISGVKPTIEGLNSHYPKKRTFISQEPHVIKEELEKKPHSKEVFGVAEAIAKLGEDGWEMVGAVPGEDSIHGITLFFKRPKEKLVSVK